MNCHNCGAKIICHDGEVTRGDFHYCSDYCSESVAFVTSSQEKP